MNQDIPDVPVQKASKRGSGGASFIWFIPLIAIGVAAFVAWQSYANQGRLIEVSFENGAGIVANTTELKYREISVGVVEDVSLSDGLKTVVARVRLNKEIGPYVDSTAQFWVVRPELTTRGISGLDTVLSGVYIEGVWDTEAGQIANQFNGLSESPLFHPSKSGLQISLRSSARGQLVDNSPILFRGIEVGRIGPASIDPRGNFAVAEAIIYEPHDRLINARNSIFNQSEVKELTVSAIFDDNISGLNIDSPVELRGLRIGSVVGVTGIIDNDVFGDERVRLNAILSIQPTRLGLVDGASAESALEFLRS